jgi:hypothetical protein
MHAWADPFEQMYEALARAVGRGGALAHLDLSRNEVGDAGAHALVLALDAGSRLVLLDLFANRVSPGAHALLERAWAAALERRDAATSAAGEAEGAEDGGSLTLSNTAPRPASVARTTSEGARTMLRARPRDADRLLFADGLRVI